MRKIAWMFTAVSLLLVTACSGGEPIASVELRDTPGGNLYRVVIDPDNFELRFNFACEPLTCKTECRIQRGEWFECESPYSLTHESDVHTVREGRLGFEVRARYDEDVSDPAEVEILVLFDFDFDIDVVHGLTTQGNYHFEDDYTATCTRPDCNLRCHWDVDECEGDCPEQACSLSSPFTLELPEGVETAELVVVACAEEFGGRPEDEHCTDEKRYLVHQAPPGWVALSAGAEHTCAISEDERLWCWGANNAGQLGISSTNNSAEVATRVAVGRWSKVSAGAEHTCAIHVDGALYCWGERGNGRLGFTPVNHRQPEKVDDGPWVDVAAGGAHTCAIRDNGQLFCWGLNVFGQLGTGNTNNVAEPASVALQAGEGGAINRWVSITAGDSHTCALGRRTNNTHGAYCWGLASHGRLGNGQTSGNYHTPQEVRGGLQDSDSHDISAGDAHTCAIATQNAQIRSFCWGVGNAGRLGTGSTNNISLPDRVEGGNDDLIEIAAGDDHSCGLHPSGQLYCWGENIRNQLGIGAEEGPSSVPVAVELPLGLSVEAIATGGEHSCAIAENGRIYCWGRREQGRLGIRNAGQIATPTMITWPQGEHVP